VAVDRDEEKEDFEHCVAVEVLVKAFK